MFSNAARTLKIPEHISFIFKQYVEKNKEKKRKNEEQLNKCAKNIPPI